MSNRVILVVDDEKNILDLCEQVFTKKQYDVRLARNAEEALSILKDEKIQVMFLDLNLPGMNGVELCKEIRKEFPLAIIHAVTGYVSLFELSDCRDAGFDDYFNKPVELTKLLKAAEDAFNKIDRWKKTVSEIFFEVTPAGNRLSK